MKPASPFFPSVTAVKKERRRGGRPAGDGAFLSSIMFSHDMDGREISGEAIRAAKKAGWKNQKRR